MDEQNEIFMDLDCAITKTQKMNNRYSWKEILNNILISENYEDILFFDSETRKAFEGITKDIIICVLLKFVIRASICDGKMINPQLQNRIRRYVHTISTYLQENSDFLNNIKSNRENLDDLSEIVSELKQSLAKEKINEILASSNDEILPFLTKINDRKNDIKSLNIKNLKPNTSTINKCRLEVINGFQLRKDNSSYSLSGDMFAFSSIGKQKDRQEDSVLILNHPKNSNFKLLIVADGVGGNKNGDLASNYATKRIMEWFESLNQDYFYKVQDLKDLIDITLRQINSELASNNDKRATTFVSSIVGSEKTLITSIGDSRAYIIKNNELVQVSKDDSYAQKLFESKIIPSKDDMRFHKSSHIITESLGAKKESRIIRIKNYLIDNKDYNILLLMSDGIFGCLSDNQILTICKEVESDEIAEKLVKKSLVTTSAKNPNLSEEEYFSYIEGGKDNSSVACLIKKKQ